MTKAERFDILNTKMVAELERLGVEEAQRETAAKVLMIMVMKAVWNLEDE